MIGIPTDLEVALGEVVAAPVNIDDADGVTGASIRLHYDTNLLDADSGGVRLGSVWPEWVIPHASVDDVAGTIYVWYGAPSSGSGSLLEIDFTVAQDAWQGQTGSTIKTALILDEVTLDPGGISAKKSDGLITIVRNEPPTLELAGTVDTLPESTDTTNRIKVADIVVTDDARGTNQLALSGAEAGAFEIDGDELFLKPGAALDFETKPQLDVVVEVDDVAVGATPDDSVALSITITDVDESVVSIPDDLEGTPGRPVAAPVNMAHAEGVRAAEIRLHYNTDLLDADDGGVRRGSVWPVTNTTVVPVVNDAAGTVVVWVYGTQALPRGAGSLVVIDFTVAQDACQGHTRPMIQAPLFLDEVILNEGNIPVRTSDGLITILCGTPAVDIAVGDLDFKSYPAVVPTGGEFWFSMTSTQQGLLTVVADPVNPGTPTLGLYNSMHAGTPLATDTQDEGVWRIDYTTAADQEYFLKLGGTSTSVDMKLANLFNKTGTTATLGGTSGLDVYEFDAGVSRALSVNGVKYAYENSELANITVNGGAGLNTIVLRDSPGDDTLDASPDQATFSNGDGDLEPNFTVNVIGMVDIQAFGAAGGHDAGTFYDSLGSDKLKVTGNMIHLRTESGQHNLRATQFDEVTVVANMSDKEKDVVVFRSTDQSETFRFNGANNTSQIQAAGRDVTAEGFDLVLAYGNGANSVAHFSDIPSSGREVFYFRSHKTQLVAKTVSVIARAFDEVHANATDNGFCVARVYDMPQNEHFEFTGDTARVYRKTEAGQELLYSAVGFKVVKAHRSEGDDTVDEQSHTYELLKRGFL